MATARRTGTNESITTYGSGQTYTLLATWESDTDNNNSGTTTSPVLECLAAQYDDVVNMGGSTNDATYFRIIRPQTGNFHSGKRDTGVQFYSTADSNAFNFAETNSQWQDLVIKTTQNSATGRSAWADSAGAGTNFTIGCIFPASSNAGSGNDSGVINNQAGAVIGFIDCLAENCEQHQFFANVTGTYFYNCTAIQVAAAAFGFDGAAGVIAKNCLATAGSGSSFSASWSASSTNNSSADTTAPGSNPRTSQTFTFVNSGANDYHLASNDAGALGFGADLSGDGTFAFDDDIDRTTISGTWNIGMDWFATATITVKQLAALGVG